MARILVLGGYGVFGSRAIERLARMPGLEIVVAGRSLAAAQAAAESLTQRTEARAEAAELDALTLTSRDLRRLRTSIVVNTVGPFQAHDYRVPRAAIDAGAHYIDLADARAFVCGIGVLDAAAAKAGVLVVSGASSVPALAAAVIDDLTPQFQSIELLTYGISPGNSFDPGTATVASIIGGAGRSFTSLREGATTTVHGWQPLVRHRFRDRRIGTRWFGACDVPDLDLFPARYPTLRSQYFVAGVEVKAFQAGLWALSWLVRAGVVGTPTRLATPLLALKRQLSFLGSDRGAMFVHLSGRGLDGCALERCWELVAYGGDGPFIPATPAVIIAKGLATGTLAVRGARPCVGLIRHADFTNEVADLDIRQSVA